jgi:adenylylsulfate kinase-like enzyme
VLWFYGLPGSGKSSVARLVLQTLYTRYNVEMEYVSMDQIRRKINPVPTYEPSERDAAYRSFVLIGSFLARNGVHAILDGTGHKKAWREFARTEIENFAEVYIKCPVDVCIERETKRASQDGIRSKLYADALERLRSGQKFKGLGKVPGVDEPFEESEDPEFVVDSSLSQPEELAKIIIEKLSQRSPELFHKLK